MACLQKAKGVPWAFLGRYSTGRVFPFQQRALYSRPNFSLNVKWLEWKMKFNVYILHTYHTQKALWPPPDRFSRDRKIICEHFDNWNEMWYLQSWWHCCISYIWKTKLTPMHTFQRDRKEIVKRAVFPSNVSNTSLLLHHYTR